MKAKNYFAIGITIDFNSPNLSLKPSGQRSRVKGHLVTHVTSSTVLLKEVLRLTSPVLYGFVLPMLFTINFHLALIVTSVTLYVPNLHIQSCLVQVQV